ncbi:MAG: hypothetical protein ACP5RX_03065 [Minisyncoccia bacterium]
MIKKRIYCRARYGYKSDVYFPKVKGRDRYNYALFTTIYNVPTKEDVRKIYEYIKEKDKGKIYSEIVVSNHEKYKYVVNVVTHNFNISQSLITNKTKILITDKTKINKIVVGDNYKKGWGIYSYNEAVKKFGLFFERTYDKLSSSDYELKIDKKCDKVSNGYAKKYKVKLAVYEAKMYFSYIVTDVPSNLIKDYAEEIERHNSYFGHKYAFTKIMNKTTLKVDFISAVTAFRTRVSI